jgi:hypothetical protein
MANGPESKPIMSREALAEYSRRLSMLSEPGVEGVYQTAYKDCAFDGKRLPPGRAEMADPSLWPTTRWRRIKLENKLKITALSC